MRLSISLIFLFISSPAWATTWYVRDGGGTATQCTGQTNAVYVSGTGQPCAFNHPAWVIGVSGYNGTPSTQLLQGGDTLYIDGDSDVTPGSQAQYIAGYGMPNSTTPCNTAGKYNCYMTNLPAGSNGAPTSVIGTGTHKPQLYSTLNSYHVLQASNNYITLQWIEITDHYNCAFNDPTNPCPELDGDPQFDGLNIAGNNLILTDVYVHGLSRYGIYGGALGNSIFTRLWVIGNGQGGFMVGQDGNEVVTGTLTFNQPIVEWNGCAEAYPLTNTGIDNPLNYSNCFGQSNGGYGDGLAFGATGGEAAGNWTLIGPGSLSFNTQDGWDILHGISGTGTDQADKLRFEGNGGQQLKITGAIDNITNNIIIGDCGWWYGAAQSEPSSMGPGDACRAGNTTIRFTVGTGVNVNFINNTIMNTGITFEYYDDGNGCDGTTVITSKNNIIGGGPQWNDNSGFISGGGNRTSTNTYADGLQSANAFPLTGVTVWPTVGAVYSFGGHNFTVLWAPSSGSSGTIQTSDPTSASGNGTLTKVSGTGDSTLTFTGAFDNSSNGAGTCGIPGNGSGGTLLFTEDYNIVYGMQNSNYQCTGTHDKCGTSPGFSAGTFPLGISASARTTYYTGQAGVTLMPIASNSAALGAGVNGLTYWNTENDYYNVSRPNPPSMGGLELNSCAVNTFNPCFFNSDCCTNNCSSNVCSTAIALPGDTYGGSLTISGVTLK